MNWHARDGSPPTGAAQQALEADARAFHIAENQPFVDGNKRTALVFLDINGWLVADPEERLFA